MKKITTITLLIAATLTGCGGVNRWEAHRDTRLAEEATAQAALANHSPTITITTLDSSGNPVTVTADLAPVIRAVTGHRAGSDRSAPPKGAVAETIDSIGRAGKEILTTPAAVGGVVAAGVAGALSETGGGGTHIRGETVTATDAFNREEIHATGDGNTAYTIGRDESSTTELMSE